jgi:hypothetical protein
MRATFGILEARAPRRAADKFALRANFAYTGTLCAILALQKDMGKTFKINVNAPPEIFRTALAEQITIKRQFVDGAEGVVADTPGMPPEYTVGRMGQDTFSLTNGLPKLLTIRATC